jgi:AraC-like DNA-binding protein
MIANERLQGVLQEADTESPPRASAEPSEAVRLWRPFSEELADVVCVERSAVAIPAQIHAQFSMTLLGSPAILRLESRRSVVAGAGSILLVPACQLYSIRAQFSTPGVTRTLLAGLGRPDQRDEQQRRAVVAEPAVGADLTGIFAELERPVRSIERIGEIGSILDRVAAQPSPFIPARPSYATPLLPVRDYLRKRLSEPVPIAALVRMSGLSEYHLIRAFHHEFGLPPHAYHVRLRLAEAGRLLARGVAVAQAAYECGFADQSHLSRRFKEVYGISPAAWARSIAQPTKPPQTARRDLPDRRAAILQTAATI